MQRSLLGLLTVLLLAFSAHRAAAETVVLPIHLDYPFIRSLVVSQLFPGPGVTAQIINEFDGCQLLELRDPQFYSEEGLLRIKATVRVRAGVPMFDQCNKPVEWEGTVDLLQRISLKMPDWELRVETVDSRYSNIDGNRTMVNKFFWNLVKSRLHSHFNQMVISLAPPLRELESLLPLFYAAEDQPRVAALLRSMRPGPIRVLADGIRAEVLMDVEDAAPEPVMQQAENPLTPEELDRFLRSWEDLDDFFALQIRGMGSFAMNDEERAEVLRILLQARYQLAAELAEEHPRPGTDMVRQQFVETWEGLAPLFRKYLVHDTVSAQLSYLAYLTAGDALVVLDRVGPTLGLEISRDGLVRLARLLAEQGASVELAYSYAVDLELRRIMGLGPEPSGGGNVFFGEEIDLELLETGGVQGKKQWHDPARWLDWLVAPAFASEAAPADLQGLRLWLVDKKNFDDYLAKVRDTLRIESEKALLPGTPLAERGALFTDLIAATAWQESCFRQFKSSQGKLTYLRSWNNSSVGLMQINERVWRGLYRVDALRWDPAYNMRAGIEIMRTYLDRYVLNKPGPLDDETLVRVAYAMYNGGPGQFKAFLGRQKSQAYYASDRLFWEKFTWARAGELDRVRHCLFGE